MTDELEDIIRRWARGGQGSRPAPQPPTEACLTFDQAAAAARDGEQPSEEAREHLLGCPRCRRLVEDFQQALTEPPVGQSAQPARAGLPLRLTLPRVIALAAAAVVLLAVGIGVYLAVSPGGAGLGDVAVGPASQIASGMTPKSPQRFASQQPIRFRVELDRRAFVSLVNLTAPGLLVALPPDPDDVALSALLGPGTVLLGPYRLVGVTGRETFLIIASRQEITDLPARLRALQTTYDQTRDPNALADQIHTWPADAKLLHVDYGPRGF